ncbi:hypothetical protein OnM2_016005 [Erysiphe neolycopersici]|uniref:Uncharacterized protein n=1 Tax=Erysiphe neolycopersici TaxID=212602 RepID=A0A420I548_9PEZI|nr:hypothetical protein OnM2_016005 [Erysiphe neolycopersici]
MGKYQCRLEEICANRRWPPPAYFLQGSSNHHICTVVVINDRFQGEPQSSEEHARESAAEKAIRGIS